MGCVTKLSYVPSQAATFANLVKHLKPPSLRLGMLQGGDGTLVMWVTETRATTTPRGGCGVRGAWSGTACLGRECRIRCA
jgi:hypothetical protein